MSRYRMLVRVLDGIRNEAPSEKFRRSYASLSTDQNEIWSARTRAYIHLYLKVMFGITDFETRERFVTDGSRDGGLDGYYIDRDKRRVYIIQSKFRHSEENFENKPIQLDELLAMEIKRVIGGEEVDEDGFEYNGKIKGLQRNINEIADIGRYDYRVVILANMTDPNDTRIEKLTDGIPFEVIDYSKSYSKLLFPVIAGTLFKATGLNIALDLSNKSSGAKIGYEVDTADFDCDITVVFVPTIEIAKIMTTYKTQFLDIILEVILSSKAKKSIEK